jgi:hypothetical protein
VREEGRISMALEKVTEILRKLSDPTKLNEMVAKEAAPYVVEAVKKDLSAGKAPDGKAWVPRKADKGQPYANAAEKLTGKSEGDLIILTVTGPEAFANDGVKGHLPVRRMLPDAGAGVPKSVAEGIQRGLDAVAEKLGL